MRIVLLNAVGDLARVICGDGRTLSGAYPPRDGEMREAVAAALAAGVTPEAFAAPPVDLAAYAKAKRDETEARGITINGLAVASAPADQTRVANAFVGMQASGAAAIRFKAIEGFVVLTLDQVKAVGAALFAHTQGCFDAENAVDAALAASPPTIATTDQVDAVFAAVPTAY